MNTFVRSSAAILIAASCSITPAIAQVDMTDDEARKSYSLGLMLGNRITTRYGDLNYEALVEGIRSQHEGTEALITLDEAQVALQEYEQAVERAAKEKAAARSEGGEAYLQENSQREGVIITESGLQYEILQEGTGEKPTAADTVSVHYVGTTIDGNEFDSSVARGQPTEFGVSAVIPGWTEGLQLMNVGSKYRFVIPANLAYGERSAGANIGPGETLIFAVELLEIK